MYLVSELPTGWFEATFGIENDNGSFEPIGGVGFGRTAAQAIQDLEKQAELLEV